MLALGKQAVGAGHERVSDRSEMCSFARAMVSKELSADWLLELLVQEGQTGLQHL